MRTEGFKSDCSLLSKYRTVLMGLAIILIMFCHVDVAQRHNEAPITRLATVLQTFTVGVDIFLFLSGFGLYYSYTKKQQTYAEFVKKRLIRILPSYFVIGGVTYLLYDVVIKHLSIRKYLFDLLFISWVKDGTTRYWYILAIMVFYLLFPMLYKYICGKCGLVRILLVSICWFAAVEYLYYSIPFIWRFRIALERLPVFLFGIYFGKLAYEKAKIHRAIVVGLCTFGYVALFALKRIIPYPFYLYYPVRAVLGISIIVTFIILMELMEHKTEILYCGIMKILKWFGGLTLELYLLHQSYMILFDFPYKLTTYPLAAFILPTVTAWIIFCVRKKLEHERVCT